MRKNIVLRAPIYSLSGYGLHSRDILKALWSMKDLFNISVIPTKWGGSSDTNNLPTNDLDMFSFVCNNKMPVIKDAVFIHVGLPVEFEKPEGTHAIGITAGLEAHAIPQSWVNSCNNIDKVFVPSKFEKNIFEASGVKTPVNVISEGVDISIFNPCTAPFTFPEDLKIDTTFNFLCTGQWLDFEIGRDRKQIGYLLDFFLSAFGDREDIGVFIKTYTSNLSTPDYYLTKERINSVRAERKGPKIYLIHGDLSDKEMAGLYTHPQINAYISFTSGEGWGRGLAEATACDLPLLVTGWSGHMDFIDKNLQSTFKFSLVEVPSEVIQGSRGIFTKGMKWAFINPLEAKPVIVSFMENYSVKKEQAKIAGNNFREKFSNNDSYDPLINYIKGLNEISKKVDLKLMEL